MEYTEAKWHVMCPNCNSKVSVAYPKDYVEEKEPEKKAEDKGEEKQHEAEEQDFEKKDEKKAEYPEHYVKEEDEKKVAKKATRPTDAQWREAVGLSPKIKENAFHQIVEKTFENVTKNI